MKAVAVFPRTKEVRVIEQEAPRLTEPDQVRVRMLEMGICGTDKEICAFEYGTPPAGSDYLVIGHESLGEVMEVGPASQPRESGRPGRADRASSLSPRSMPSLSRRLPGLLHHR